MGKRIGFKAMLEELPEHRKGSNTRYTLVDAGLSALSVFYMQSPSFLSWQQDMEKKQGKNNARSLFGIEGIPSNEQTKNLLDPVSEEDLGEPYWQIYHGLEANGQFL